MTTTRPSLSAQTRALVRDMRAFLDTLPEDRKQGLKQVTAGMVERTPTDAWLSDLDTIAKQVTGPAYTHVLMDAVTLMAADAAFVRIRRTSTNDDAASFAAAMNGAAAAIATQLVYERDRR